MIAGVGSINVDYIIHVEHLPVPGETKYGKKETIMAGGKGANQIAAVARLGGEAIFLSKIGGLDHYNDLLFDDFKWAGIDTKYIETADDILTGAGFVMVAEDSQNSIIIMEGANKFILPEYVIKHKDVIERANICMTEFMIPTETCECAMRLAKEAGVTTLVNPAPARAVNDDFYRYIDIITPNEIEAAFFCGFVIDSEDAASKACDYFHGKGVKKVVVTLGSKGAYVSDGDTKIILRANKVDALDTSGAGDCFNGAFAYALDRGHDIFESAKFANAAASVSVTRIGTMRSMPSLKELEAVYKLA
jgi:ribokinase